MKVLAIGLFLLVTAPFLMVAVGGGLTEMAEPAASVDDQVRRASADSSKIDVPSIPADSAGITAPSIPADSAGSAAASVLADSSVFVPHVKPTLIASRAPGPIEIDGDLSDPGWQGAARATGFAEHSPVNLARPPVDSEAWVTYDDERLYVALIARDDPGDVRVSLCERDNIFNDDYFGVMFDTYGDLARAYELFVNPAGIQGDLRLTTDGFEEIGFDIIWDARGKVTPSGYQVEIAVPFSSLRFPESEEQVWRIDFWRDHQREVRRRYSWAGINQDDPCWLCQWGTLRGIRGIHPGKHIDVIASAIGHQVAEREDRYDPQAPYTTDDPGGRLSLNVRYGLSTSSSAEITLRPDFSQIESDAAQIEVNTPFALSYPERRPFFQEGGDMYNMWINAIYTRSINDPWAAAKYTASYGPTAVLYLLARDSNTPYLLPGEEGSYEPLADNGISGLKSVSNVVRVRHMLGGGSHVGLAATDRRMEGEAGGSGTVLSVDSRLRFLKHYCFQIQGLASRTEEPNDTSLTRGINQISFGDGHTYAFDGERYWGHALFANIDREAHHFYIGAEYQAHSPEFRTDNGFTERNDFQAGTLSTVLGFEPNRRVLQAWQLEFVTQRDWNYAGDFRKQRIDPTVELALVGQTGLEFGAEFSHEQYHGKRFDGLWQDYVEVNTRPNEFIAGAISAGNGRTIYRTAENPRAVKMTYLDATTTLKLMRRMGIEPSVNFYRLDELHGGEIVSGVIVRARLSYNFTRQLHTRLIVQYDEFADRFDLEPLLTYRVNPFTVIYLGATSSQVQFAAGAGADVDSGLAGLPNERWKPVSRQIFAKVQILWRA